MEMQADLRDEVGGGSSRNLIRAGKVPAIIYGDKHPNVCISIGEKEITKLFKSGALTSTVVNLTLGSEVYKTLVKQIQLDPVKDTVRHVDFIFINPEQQKVDVPIIFEGKERSVGVKRGGSFNIAHRKIKLLCEPDKIPQRVMVDVLNMRVGDKLLAGKIPLPEGSKLAIKEDEIIAKITGSDKGGAEPDDKPAEAANAKAK